MQFLYEKKLEEIPMVLQLCDMFVRGWLVKSEEIVF